MKTILAERPDNAARCTRHALAMWLGLGLVASGLSAGAAEYFVNQQGHDGNQGQGRDQAFATIQKGLDVLRTGDTLTIGPGEYFEHVTRDGLGGPDADTVIRSEVPGMAILRGDVPAPEFRKIEGYRFVYGARFEQTPQAVLEHHQRRVLFPKANVTELEFNPGCFHYDANARMLYIANADLVAPDQRRYTVAVDENSGLVLTGPERVVIEGLAATGFHPGWGILLTAPERCVVRDCVSFLNVGGITLQPPAGVGAENGGSHNMVERCVCFGNSFGGIVRYAADHDIIRNCRTYGNVREGQEHFGIMHYAGMSGPLLIQDNISWGQNFDYSVKPKGRERLERCVALGFVRNANMFHNLIGGGNEYDRSSSAPADNILFRREPTLDRELEFADPLNLDFRLQSDSRFRGTAPDKSDRGPYPYTPNVFYAAAAGDDQANGLSLRKPWRTLDRAFRALRPGDTLYLAEGDYAGATWNKPGDGQAAIRVCGRGRGAVTIQGRLSLTGGARIVLERLNFADEVAVSDGREIAFQNCTFFGAKGGLAAQRAAQLKVTHSLFAGVPLDLKQTAHVTLAGNIFAGVGKVAVRLDAPGTVGYSDYNNYQDAAQCWEIARASRSLQELQPSYERHSHTLAPELGFEKGVPRLRNEGRFRSLGPHSTALGLHHEYAVAAESLSIVGPFLHSTSDTSANLEWWSSHPATYTLAWGETPEMKNTVAGFAGRERFNTFSLTGLKPGRTYHFAIRVAEARVADGAQKLPRLRPEGAQVSFTTAASPAAPKTYYVAPDGSDANTGLSRNQAFQTVNRAAVRVGPGDTVLIAGGDYAETVRLRAAGTKERPITFRAVPGEKPLFQGEHLSLVFQVVVKPDNRFDGLYFDAGFWDSVMVVRQSPRVQVTRCLKVMLAAEESPGIVVRNCVVRGGWNGLSLSRSRDSLVENNVFLMTILRHISCDSPAIVRSNVFCECIRGKAHQTLLELGPEVRESNNCFYLRWPEDEKLAINHRPLTEYRVRTGSDARAANPMLPGTPGWMQGWQQSKVEDFPDCFAANPLLIKRGIGLEPSAFSDSKFKNAWPYDAPWAEQVIAGMDAAAGLARAGQDSEALAAYRELAATVPMPDRLKSQLLENASRCAQRMKDWDQALKLAKSIPVEPLAMHRQMELLLDRKQYAELIESFTSQKLGGRNFHLSYCYPELEDVMADLYYFRSLAYCETGNLAAAEADLKIMNDKRTQLSYRSGEAIHDLAWLRVGDFYRQYLQDDDRALTAYANVLARTTWAPWGQPRKPAATGGHETLAAATKAVSDILRKRGKDGEIPQLQFNLLLARAEAAASLLKTNDMTARLEEALAVPGRFTPAMDTAARRILALDDDARGKVVSAADTLATDLTDDMRSLLLKMTAAPERQARESAVRALLLFAPLDKVGELVDNAGKEKPEARPRGSQ